MPPMAKALLFLLVGLAVFAVLFGLFFVVTVPFFKVIPDLSGSFITFLIAFVAVVSLIAVAGVMGLIRDTFKPRRR